MASLKFEVLQYLQTTNVSFTAMGLDDMVRDIIAQLDVAELQQLAVSPHPEIGPWATTCLAQRRARAATTIQRAIRRAWLTGGLSSPFAKTKQLWEANPGIHAHFQGDFKRFARAILQD